MLTITNTTQNNTKYHNLTKQKPHPEVSSSCLLIHIIKLITWLAAIILIEYSILRPQRGPFDYLKRN